MERTINDIVSESEEQGEQSQWTPETETEQPKTKMVWVEETIVRWGKNVRGVQRHTHWVRVEVEA